MTGRYRLDPGPSRFTVQAFASGLLSFLGHSPTFAVRVFSGEARFDPGSPDRTALQLTAQADSLELLDKVNPGDRREIEDRMRREVLETAAYPQVRFESAEGLATPISEERYRLRLAGQLVLHGVANRHEVDAELAVYSDGIRLIGESALQLPDYWIKPVAALGGTIRLKDRLRVVFDLAAWKEDREQEES